MRAIEEHSILTISPRLLGFDNQFISDRLALFVLLASLCTNTAAAAVTSTSISLATSPNPAVLGAPVTLTASVSPGTATGKVTFYDGTAVLGISSIVNGVAIFQTSLLAAGRESIWALYQAP